METRALLPSDKRDLLESGDPDIDRFFHSYAGQTQWRHHVGVTFCAFIAGSPAAFVTLSAGTIDPASLPAPLAKRLASYPAPVLRLARLGVDRRCQGTGLDREMLYATADIALEMRARVGCIGVLVDAKPPAVGFYERHGFRVVPVTSRMAGAGAPPVRLFSDLRHLLHGAAAARDGLSSADGLAAEMRRRARELGLSAEDVRTAVDRMLG